MKVERNGADTVYRIAWKDVVLILENPIVKTLKSDNQSIYPLAVLRLFITFNAVSQRFMYDRSARYNYNKRELLSRETYSRNPINYSAGMAEDQKDRYIQYLAEQNQDLRLTGDAMRLVLEDFMAQMKELKDQMSSMQSKHVDLENRLSEEHKLRKSAERKIKSLQENLITPIRNVLVIDVKRYNLKLKQVIQTAGRRRMIMMEPMIRFARIRLVMFHPKS